MNRVGPSTCSNTTSSRTTMARSTSVSTESVSPDHDVVTSTPVPTETVTHDTVTSTPVSSETVTHDAVTSHVSERSVTSDHNLITSTLVSTALVTAGHNEMTSTPVVTGHNVVSTAPPLPMFAAANDLVSPRNLSALPTVTDRTVMSRPVLKTSRASSASSAVTFQTLYGGHQDLGSAVPFKIRVSVYSKAYI